MGIAKKKSSNVIFSKVQQSILRLLFLHPETDYYTNEIIKNVNSGTGSVQRELQKFVDAEIITVKKIGNQKRYQANPALSYFKELRGIVIKTFGMAEILSETLKKALDSRIKIAFIYGSIAKQQDNEGSDVDLLIIDDNITYSDIFQSLQEIEIVIARKINPSIYSHKEWVLKLKQGNNFATKIMKQPKIFILGNESVIKQLR